MIRAVVLFCGIFLMALTPDSVNAMTAEQTAQIKAHFEKIGLECIADNPITEQDINDLRSKQVPSGPGAPCFVACMMRKIGVLDAHGMLESETALEIAKEVFHDEDELKIIADFLHSCKGANSEAVSDGEKGCERAIIAFKCMRENAPQFGIDV